MNGEKNGDHIADMPHATIMKGPETGQRQQQQQQIQQQQQQH